MALGSSSNYVILSPSWDAGAATDAGAVTWGSGTAGAAGVGVTSTNSLVDRVRMIVLEGKVSKLCPMGTMSIATPFWDSVSTAAPWLTLVP